MTATIQDLYKRSIVDKFSGCWRWQGAKRKDGLPSIWTLDYDRAEKRTTTGPRAVWMIANKSSPNGLVYRCCAIDCVNPTHMRVAKDRDTMVAAIVKAGKFKTERSQSARKANVMHAWRAKGIVETPEHQVREIRASSEPLATLAARYGISGSAVSQIRLRQARAGVA